MSAGECVQHKVPHKYSWNYYQLQNLGAPGIHHKLSGHRQYGSDCTKIKFFKIQA